MNKIILKKMCGLAIIFGAIGGALCVLPFVGLFTFLLIICFLAPVVFIILKRNRHLGVFESKESALYGAIIGFVGFVAYSIVMVPLAAIFSWVNAMWFHKMAWFSIMNVLFGMGFSGFIMLVMLLFLVGLLAAIMNAFCAMITAGVYQMLEGNPQKNDDAKIDVEIN